jgi:hypothetical protein
MKVKITKEFAEEVTIAYLKELYENLVVADVQDTQTPRGADLRSDWKEKVERSAFMAHILGILRELLIIDDFVEFLENTHLKHYGEKRT